MNIEPLAEPQKWTQVEAKNGRGFLKHFQGVAMQKLSDTCYMVLLQQEKKICHSTTAVQLCENLHRHSVQKTNWVVTALAETISLLLSLASMSL